MNAFAADAFCSSMDPAMCIEAEEARLSQCVADALECVLEGARRLTRQHEIVEELERVGGPTEAARHQLASLAADHSQEEDSYRRCLRRLEQLG